MCSHLEISFSCQPGKITECIAGRTSNIIQPTFLLKKVKIGSHSNINPVISNCCFIFGNIPCPDACFTGHSCKHCSYLTVFGPMVHPVLLRFRQSEYVKCISYREHTHDSQLSILFEHLCLWRVNIYRQIDIDNALILFFLSLLLNIYPSLSKQKSSGFFFTSLNLIEYF